jgi:Protein of unknown function (DUF1328).
MEDYMLRASLMFFVLALVALLVGATGFAGVSMEIGRLLLVAYLVLAVISFLVGIVSGRSPKNVP